MNNRKAVSLVEMMIAILVLGIGIVFVTKMFGQGGYLIAKSKWELMAMCIANGEIENINFFKGSIDNLKNSEAAKNYLDKWAPVAPSDFLANTKVPDDYVNADFQKRIKIDIIKSTKGNFLAKVNVSVKWHEMTTSGLQNFQLNVPTLISTPKPFYEYKN